MIRLARAEDYNAQDKQFWEEEHFCCEYLNTVPIQCDCSNCEPRNLYHNLPLWKNSNLSIFGTFVYHSQKLCNNFCLFLPFSSIESSTTASRQDGWIAPSQLQGGHVWKFGKHLEKHLVKYQHSQWSFDKYNLILLFIVITCPATWLPRFLVTWRWPRSELQANFSLSYINLGKVNQEPKFYTKIKVRIVENTLRAAGNFHFLVVNWHQQFAWRCHQRLLKSLWYCNHCNRIQ